MQGTGQGQWEEALLNPVMLLWASKDMIGRSPWRYHLAGSLARPSWKHLSRPLSPSPRSNIIDVSAADSQGMEQHEYMDRARQYR